MWFIFVYVYSWSLNEDPYSCKCVLLSRNIDLFRRIFRRLADGKRHIVATNESVKRNYLTGDGLQKKFFPFLLFINTRILDFTLYPIELIVHEM